MFLHSLRLLPALAPLLLSAALAVCPPKASAAAVATEQRIEEIAAMLPPQPSANGPAIADRQSWNSLREKARAIIADADRFAKEPIPELPGELYLEFSRTGVRPNYEKPYALRGQRLAAFALAECVTGQGRYLEPFQKELEAILGEKTWTLPAHDPQLKNFNGETVDVDLGAAMRAGTIATAVSWLGEKLPAPLKEKALSEITRRVFDPYRVRIRTGGGPCSWWVEEPHNWNAVCHAGVVTAALAILPDPRDRAEIIAGAEHYIQYYLKGFLPDGYCIEGIGYWEYGFGHYITLAEAVYRATGGKINWYEPPIVGKVALFPDKFRLAPGLFPTFADCGPNRPPSAAKPSPTGGGSAWVSDICAVRFGIPRFIAETAELPAFSHPLGSKLYQAAIYDFPLPGNQLVSIETLLDPLRTWYPDGGVLIEHPGPDAAAPSISVAIKGGRNVGGHHHNDLGSFIVATKGYTPLTDPGAEPYSATTFGPRRYDNEMINSFGHSAPVVAGQLQKNGPEAFAKVLSHRFTEARDCVTYDLTSAYNVPSLQQLRRTFTYTRGNGGALEIQDQVTFYQPQPFATAFITKGIASIESGDSILVTDGPASLRIQISTDGTPVKITQAPLKTALPKAPTRISVELQEPTSSARLVYRITPVSNAPASRD